MKALRQGMARITSVLALLFVLSATESCVEGPAAEATTDVHIDTLGNTITVHTLAGSRWFGSATLEPVVSIGVVEGEPEYVFGRVASLSTDTEGNIYVLDSQAAEIRSFDSSGRYIRTYGRRGAGPGELASPAAIAVHSDGRVLVRDTRNQRVQVFSPSGEASEEWPVVNPTYFSSAPLWTDSYDRTLVETKEQAAGGMDAEIILIEVVSDGTVLDTIPHPTANLEIPVVEVVSRSGRGRAQSAVPFSAQPSWSLHQNGAIVVAMGDEYRIDMIYRSGDTLLIRKDYEAVPVARSERVFSEARITRVMRRANPDWVWNGPRIPSVKPPLKGIFAARDGRIWAWISNPGIELKNPNYDPEREGSTPTIWDEAVSFDVFEPDGTYLGRVDAPNDFSFFPAPVFDAEGAWSVVQDELGFQKVVRFTLRIPSGS